MNDVPRTEAVTKPGGTMAWGDLAEELDRWAEAGRIARFWWRDDDAVRVTPPLDRLISLARDTPIALAMIPAEAETGLAAHLSAIPSVSVLQHGWSHRNHATQGKKSEYPAQRTQREVRAELAAGRARLVTLFGTKFLPVLVPPWNRFASDFLPCLSEAGLSALSVMAGSHAPALPAGIAAMNVHVDLVAWHSDRGFIGLAPAITGLVEALRTARRVNAPAAPIGILTHHLIMDDGTADFIAGLSSAIRDHLAARWTAPAEMLR